MVMRLAVAVMLLVLLTGKGAGGAARPDDITATNVLALEAWVGFVKGHTPGRQDAAARAVSQFSLETRQALYPGLPLFLSRLKGQYSTARTAAQRRILEIAREAELTLGANGFLKRAAVLHADAAISVGPRAWEPVEPGHAGAFRAPASPLLSDRTLFLDHDGEILGEVRANWNWPFARSLLDLVGPRPADDPFVAAWYHATTAYMFANGMYGEVSSHLAQAADVVPDDPRILFDRACFLEIQGLPVSQVLLTDTDLLALRAQQMGARNARPAQSRGVTLGIPPKEQANDRAEALFRRALRADPYLVEARVRLGRLLTVRKRYEEAAAELDKALEGGQGGIVMFYARLFAGRAAQSLGRLDDAARHYTAAGAIFPGAQSALLARSQLAVLQADVPVALTRIEHLDKSSSASDPWWKYHLATGRDVDALLADMWGKVLQP
jgi:thioredoxin-like negative regulator of GroEL